MSRSEELPDFVPAPARKHVDGVSRFLGGFRWVFMPLALLALIAVGVHAAAERLDYRILSVVEGLDAAFDSVVGRWSWTASWVDLIGEKERVMIARAITLLWELSADVILAWPALGYRERALTAHNPSGPTHVRSWRMLIKKARQHPTAMIVIRPVATALICLAGACAVGRMVQGQIFLSLHALLPDGFAGVLARVLALLAVAGVLWRFGWRAALRSLEDAYVVSQEDAKTPGSKWWLGTPASIWVLPLAITALVDASPLWSFFR